MESGFFVPGESRDIQRVRSAAGDLYLVVMIKLPEKLNDAARTALTALAYDGDVRGKLAL